MRKWLQNLSGVVIASVLAVALNGKAFADEPKPEPPSVEIGTSVAFTETPASGAAAAGDASAAGSAAPEIQTASASGSDASASGSDASASGSDVSASGSDASASGDDASAFGSDAFVSDSDASASGSDTHVADTLTVVADVLVADTPVAEAPAATDMPTAAVVDTGGSDNPSVTTDQVVAKRGLKAMASGSGMRGGAGLADTGENNDGGENNDTGENGNGENGDGDDSSISDPKPDPVSMFNQVDESSYVLVNYSLTEALSADGDITIHAAGLNYIPELSVDGNINLIGTGILLVDKIEMTEGKEFSLQPNIAIYGADGGSVAVFLKRVEQTTDAEGNPCEVEYYELINGGVDGILDEEYTIPEGVTLVVPDNSRLVMQSVAVIKHTYDGAESVYYSLSSEPDALRYLPGYYVDDQGYHYQGHVDGKSTSPKLTIAERAKLVVQQQAALVMNAVGGLHGGGYEPQIEVSGILELNSDTGGGSVVVKNTGDLTGSGNFIGTTIDVDGGRTDPVTAIHAQTGVVINLSGDRADLGVLTASGDSILTYKYGSSSIDVVEVDGCLKCYTEKANYGETKELSILNGISGGGRMELYSGVYILGENCRVTDGSFIGAGGTTASVYDYYLDENGNSNLSPSESPRVETKNQSQNSGGSNSDDNGGTPQESSSTRVTIPCILTKVTDQPDWWGRITSYLESAEHNDSLSYSCWTSDEVTYDSLIDAWKDTAYYKTYYSEATIPSMPVVLLETEVNGVWSSVLMAAGWSNPTVLAENIKTIRIVTWGDAVTLGQGSGYITATNTAYTGSGVLGGSGAGSVSGGTATSILTGTGLHINDQTQQNSDSGNGNTGTTNNNTGNQTADPEPAPLVAFVDQPEEPAPIWVEVVPEVSTAADAEDAAEPEAAPTTTETTYVLLALEGEKTLDEMGGKASVSMSYTPPAEYEGKTLYVVFRDESNNLVAIRATYSDVTHLLQFITDRLGEFMVVGFNFDSTEFKEFSPEFYEALAKLPELENLLFSEVGTI